MKPRHGHINIVKLRHRARLSVFVSMFVFIGNASSSKDMFGYEKWDEKPTNM